MRLAFHAGALILVAVTLSLLLADPADARTRRQQKAVVYDPFYLITVPAAPRQAVSLRRKRKARRLAVPQLALPALVAPAAVAPTPVLATSEVLSAFPVGDTSKLELTAGGLTALVTQESPAGQPAAGDSVYASVVVQGSGPAELLVEAEGGDLQPLLGTSITTGETPAGQIARFDLGTDGRTAVTIELRANDKTRSRLRLTLNALSGATLSDNTILGWRRQDCAGDYYSAIQGIRNERVPMMAAAVDQVLAPYPALSGTWLLGKPAIAATPATVAVDPAGAKRRCIEWRQRTDYVTNEQSRSCKRWKGDPLVPADGEIAAIDLPSEADVVRLADGFVKSKLIVKAFERKRVLRLKSFDLMNSLRNYIEQPPHRALCTGVPQMLGYYLENTSVLADSIGRMERVADAAARYAAEQAAIVTGTPVAELKAGAATLISTAAAAPTPSPTLAVTLSQLARHVLSPADAAQVAAEADHVAAIKLLANLMSAQPKAAADASGVVATEAASVPADPQMLERRVVAGQALGMLEAAVVLDAARQRFQLFDRAGYGTAEAIGNAHATHCKCSQ